MKAGRIPAYPVAMVFRGALGDGGASLRSNRPGGLARARWSILVLGLVASATIHALLMLWTESLPWSATWRSDSADTGDLYAGFVLLAGLLVLVRAAASFDREGRHRPNAWVLAAAALAGSAAIAGMLSTNAIATTGGNLQLGDRSAGLTYLLAAYTCAVPLALFGAWRTVRGEGARTGWIWILHVLVAASWFGGQAWHKTISPLPFDGPDEMERCLVRTQHALALEFDPRDITPVLQVRADGSVEVKHETYAGPWPDGDVALVREYLAETALRMRKRPLDPDDPYGPTVPVGWLTILPHAGAPYERVHQLLRLASEPPHGFSRFRLGTQRAERPWLGAFDVYSALDPADATLGVGARLATLQPLGADGPHRVGLGPLAPGTPWDEVARALDEAHANPPLAPLVLLVP